VSCSEKDPQDPEGEDIEAEGRADDNCNSDFMRPRIKSVSLNVLSGKRVATPDASRILVTPGATCGTHQSVIPSYTSCRMHSMLSQPTYSMHPRKLEEIKFGYGKDNGVIGLWFRGISIALR